jgi:hypothetical protein
MINAETKMGGTCCIPRGNKKSMYKILIRKSQKDSLGGLHVDGEK